MRSTRFLASGLLVFASLGLATPGQAQSPTSAVAPDAFQAKAIVALSDADMVPSAYVDDKLGPPAGIDVLSVVGFDRRRVAPVSVQTLPISNSVTGPPAAVATTPDGRYAITIETRGPRASPDAGGTLTSLPNGRLISVVDLADLRHPRVVQQVVGPRRAVGLSISADGTLVALAIHPAGDGMATPLWLYRFKQGRLSGGTAVPIPD